MNTAIPVGINLGDGFQGWKDCLARQLNLDCSTLIKRACSHLVNLEAQAYEAPFSDKHHNEAVLRFPQLVMFKRGMEGIKTAKRVRKY